MKRLIGILLALLFLGASGVAATPKVEPALLGADLSYWGLNQGAPYPKLVFYEGGVPWLGWVGNSIYYTYASTGCAQSVTVYVPACTGCAASCPAGTCSKATVEGMANAGGVYRVLRFESGPEYWGSDPIPYAYDAGTGLLTLTLPGICNGGQ